MFLCVTPFSIFWLFCNMEAIFARVSADLWQYDLQIILVSAVIFAAIAVWAAYATNTLKVPSSRLSPYLQFAYNNFLKPHDSKAGDGQQSALESFYARQVGRDARLLRRALSNSVVSQASIYDTTRKRLLCGREDMLAMVAAQLQSRSAASNTSSSKPVWYDIGGGTGYNIEAMDKIVGVENTFAQVFLVDFSPSLCAVARERVARCGWKNVTVLCDDARRVQCAPGSADLITMSYSLSMIPDFYSVVDLLTTFLSPNGTIGIVDFYVQSLVDISSRNYVGGTFNRHVNWFGRMFWRTWFEADRVNLDAGRRDYVEYRFGTILSCSERNYLLGGIPYYKFIGCRRDADTSTKLVEQEDAVLTESPYLSANEFRKQQDAQTNTEVIHSKSYESAIVNLSANLPLPSAFYQLHTWRIHYNELLDKHQHFKNEYIYAFNWEDPTVDRQLLNINSSDVILTITSAGDNILDYLLESPKRIHAVDLNPNQNHLLELKVAAFTVLPYADLWALFGEGRHPNFRQLLLTKLSPHLSSQSFQYWLNHASVFSSKHGLYETGGSRHAIQLVRRLFRLLNMTTKVQTLCSVETMNEQRELWPQIRDVLLSWPLHKLIVSTEWWAWRAAGVPKEQRDLILDDFSQKTGRPKSKKECGEAIWQYMVDTLDPVVENTQLSRENYFYYVCLQGKYSKK
jgi:betaine lipid synthase